MRGGAERYHTASLDTIQQQMTFEQATETKDALSKKKSTRDKGGRDDGRFQRGGGPFNRVGRG